jgi:hypothetical protein
MAMPSCETVSPGEGWVDHQVDSVAAARALLDYKVNAAFFLGAARGRAA